MSDVVDLSRLYRRVRDKGRDLASEAPSQARHAADEARRTAGALGDVLDERSGGRFGDALARGEGTIGKVARTPGEARDAFRDEASREGHRPEGYRPDPIDAPAPIDRPEPI